MPNPRTNQTIIDWTATDIETFERIRNSLDRHIIELRARKKPAPPTPGPKCDICGNPATHREFGDLTAWQLCDNCGIPGKK